MTEVLINKENSTIILTLNRERVLNALNLNMVRIISENISSWNDDDGREVGDDGREDDLVGRMI